MTAPVYYCPRCRERFEDEHARGVASGPGGMAPAECPKCGEEESITPAPFPCSGCGICCTYIKEIEDIAHLADESGRCRNLGPDNKTCLIYETRPFICRIDEVGKHLMVSRSVWHEVNRSVCHYIHQRFYGAPLEEPGIRCNHEVDATSRKKELETITTGSSQGSPRSDRATLPCATFPKHRR